MKFIAKKKFAKTVLHKQLKTLVIYITALKTVLAKLFFHLDRKT